MAKRISVVFPFLLAVFTLITVSPAAQDSSKVTAAQVQPGKSDVSSAAAAQTAVPAAAAPKDTSQKPQSQLSQTAAVPSQKDTTSKTPIAAAPAPAASTKKADLQNKKPVEEDLYEEMLVPEKGAAQPVPSGPAVKKADTAAAAQKPADTSKSAAPPVKIMTGAADTAKSAQQPVVAAPAADTAKKTAVSAKTVAPARVEEARQINFARNLKDYRSPKLAMLMSLLVPGLGQAYVKSYVKTGLFALAEAAIITASVVYNNKGKSQYNQATAFADNNYSASKMQTYYTGLFNYLQTYVYPGADAQSYDKLNSIYFDTLNDPNSSFAKSARSKSQSYYSTIQSNEYIQGWNDCQPTLDQIATANGVPGAQVTDAPGFKYKYSLYDSLEYSYLVTIQDKITGAVIDSEAYGYSNNLLMYRNMVSQSNSSYKIATNILFIVLLNHVVSAVDALISARVYNDALLGKQSFWRHIDLEPGLASSVTAGPAMTLRILF
jgi:hypothetical protein